MMKKKCCVLFLFLVVSAFLNAHHRYVLTGGPGVGKSSVIDLLEKKGYQTVPEVWTMMYNEAKKYGRLEAFSGQANSGGFRKKLMEVQLSLEHTLNKNQPAFLDRSVVDTVAFGHLYNIAMPQSMCDVIQKNRYDLIFMLDPLPKELYNKTELCSLHDSMKIHDYLRKFYTQAGYHIIHVPFDSPAKRMAFILRHALIYEANNCS